MKIALDFDGVIADFDEKIRQEINNYYGMDIPITYLFEHDWKRLLGIDEEEEEKFLQYLFADISDVEPMPGAIGNIIALQDKGIDFIIATHRKNREEVFFWLKKHGLEFLIARSYFMKLGDEMPEVDFFIDDSGEKLAKYRKKIRKQAFLMNSAMNKACLDVFGRIMRVDSWKAFYHYINGEINFQIHQGNKLEEERIGK